MSLGRRSDSYPILVERFSGEQSMRIVCEGCGAEETIGPDDLVNDGWYSCPKDCGTGHAVYKYDEAVKCGGCGRLGYWVPILDYCCSRVCMLQAEYAKKLAAR